MFYPFSEDESETIKPLGEIGLINRIRDWLGDASPESPAGIGDDSAALELPSGAAKFLITADPVIYGRHFEDSLAPDQVAAKLAKRNLSDIAAMGGQPLASVVSLSIPGNLKTDWLERFYLGLKEQANAYNFSVAGGDVSQTDSFLGIFMTMTGVSQNRILERGRANEGSLIYVTGELGGSILSRHYAFEPRLAEGKWLAQQSEVLGCLDLSDGLGKDCASLLSANCIACLDCEKLPISKDAISLSERSGKTPLYHSINDGEDFELLFAIKPREPFQDFEERWRSAFDTPLSRIGVVETPGKHGDSLIRLVNTSEKIDFSGYEHFRKT